jgi:hypothetical protein
MKYLASLALFACTFAICLATSPVGTWSGHVDVSGVKAKDAKEQKQLDMMKQMFSSMMVKITFKGDKTCTISASFGAASKGGAPQSQSGKWSQKGQVVTVTDSNGKSQAMTMSANGKQMLVDAPSGGGGPKGAKFVFVRS